MHESDAVQRTANIIVFMIWQWKKYNLFTQKSQINLDWIRFWVLIQSRRLLVNILSG